MNASTLNTLLDGDNSTAPSFAEMVRKRRKNLWSIQDDQEHDPQTCEHELLTRVDDLTKWHCCQNWHRKLSNKLNAKEFAEKCGIASAKLYWVGNKPEDIPFSSLLESYTVKLTNGSGSKQVIPISNGKDIIRNKLMSEGDIKSCLKRMMTDINDDLNLILIEELLEDRFGELPHDFKFFCFHGKVQILYEYDRAIDTHCWYDKNWKPIHDPIHCARPRGKILPEPPNLQSLIEAAEILARAYEFSFVRIDLYNIKGVPYFGEFTHTPFGNELDSFTPFANRTLGLLSQNPALNFIDTLNDL